MPVTDNDGVRLHWDEEGEGPPVLLVMGHRFMRAASQVIDLDTGGTAVPATVSRSVAFVVCESGPDRWRS
jgi:hypothetical protein